MQEQSPDLSIITLNGPRVMQEFADLNMLGRTPYANMACATAEDSDAIWQATTTYQSAYTATMQKLPPNDRLNYAIQEIGIADGTDFRLVAIGVKPAAKLPRTLLRAEARPDGALPDVGFVPLFDDQTYTEPHMPGYFFNPRAVNKVLELHRDLFDCLGYTSTDPRDVATAVFSDRSPIGTSLLLGHSVEQALFGNTARLAYSSQATYTELHQFGTEIAKIFGAKSAQTAIIGQLLLQPEKVETMDLLANDPDSSLMTTTIWEQTGMSDFLQNERTNAFGALDDEPWTKAL